MKFQSKSVEEHSEAPLPDDGRWEKLVDHWTTRESTDAPPLGEANACFVLSVHHKGARTAPHAQLAEIVGLVQAQGDRVVGQICHELVRPDPKTLLRKGVSEKEWQRR